MIDDDRKAIEEIRLDHPELTDFGFGVFGQRSKTPEQRANELAENRALMQGIPVPSVALADAVEP
jgi:hypothetical protein